jgi:hypothetical protein
MQESRLSPATVGYRGRKRRYILITIIAVPAIAAALIFAHQQGPYANSILLNFDSYGNSSIGKTFVRIDTGTPQPKGIWVIKTDPSAPSKSNVLARLSNGESGSDYHMLIKSAGIYSSFQAEVKFKVVSGKQSFAGLVIRFQDTDRYFVLQADAKNHKFSLCRAQPGIILCTQDTTAYIASGQWHSIVAQVAGAGGEPGVVGYLDGIRLIQRYDTNYMNGGQIGLWTKGDSTVYFDDLSVSY